MINSKHLRIKNWAYDPIANEYFQISASDLVALELLEKKNRENKFYKAIPMTPAILALASSVFNHGSFYSFAYGEGSEHNPGTLIILVRGDKVLVQLGKSHNRVCETVHEFQNVVFAITGNEVEIDLLKLRFKTKK